MPRRSPNPTVAAVLDRAARAYLARHRIARLATADAGGTPHVVPLCYAVSGDQLYFVVDDKPKHPGGRALKRMRNIAENPAVALVVDDYAEDWRSLAFLLVHGRAAIVDGAAERTLALKALRLRYRQYRAMDLDGPEHPVVRITPSRVHQWKAAGITRRGGGARSTPRAGAGARPMPRPRQSRSRPR